MVKEGPRIGLVKSEIHLAIRIEYLCVFSQV